MKKRILIILFLSVATNLTANAEKFMSRALNSWMGYTIDDLIDVWGYPNDIKQIAGRNIVYWTNNQYHISSNQFGVYGEETYCNKIIEINDKNEIISWQYEGNSCPKFYFTGKKLVNPQNDEWKKKKQLKKAVRAKKD